MVYLLINKWPTDETTVNRIESNRRWPLPNRPALVSIHRKLYITASTLVIECQALRLLPQIGRNKQHSTDKVKDTSTQENTKQVSKVIWRRQHRIRARHRDCCLIKYFLAPKSLSLKQNLDPLSRVCEVKPRDRPGTHRQSRYRIISRSRGHLRHSMRLIKTTVYRRRCKIPGIWQ